MLDPQSLAIDPQLLAAAVSQQLAAQLRTLADQLEGSDVVQISLDQPLEYQVCDKESAAKLAGCKPDTLVFWKSSKGWIEGIHYQTDGSYNAAALKHWRANLHDPSAHSDWCARYEQTRKKSGRKKAS